MRVRKGLIISLLSIFLYQCAQMVSPTGGKKDEIPPKLVSSIPDNKATNFKENVISLTFDEYVAVDNLMQKLIITPETDNTYTPQVKNQTVILKFRKPFNDSTTYTFNFSDGIKDIAERNPAQNLKLVFSTSTAIDSGRVYGTIKDIRTNKPAFDVLVGLYKLSDTLNPEKIKPYYFARTDSSGRFELENTQIASYSLIAVTDKNKNLLYNPKEESIAFLDSVVHVTSDTSNYQLSLFHSDITPLRVQRTIPKVNDYTLVFNKGLEKAEITFPEGQQLYYQLESPTQLKIFNVPVQTDTVRTTISVTDSLGYSQEIEQKVTFLPQRGKERQSSPFTVKSDQSASTPVEQNIKLGLTFNKPVLKADSAMITVTADSAQRIKTEHIRTIWSDRNTRLDIEATTTAKDSIVIRIEKGAILSIEGDTLASTTYKHPIIDPSDFGILRGTVQNPNNLPFFIELLDKEFKTVILRTDKSPFTFKNIKPDTYRLRLIIDANRNGKWDTGNYSRKIQPEKILVYPAELIIKANFEYEDQYFDLSGQPGK